MDPDLHTLAGAPETVWMLYDIASAAASGSGGANGIQLDLEVRMFNKTATRLPESIFVVFRPAFASGMEKQTANDCRDNTTARGADNVNREKQKHLITHVKCLMAARQRRSGDHTSTLDHGWRLQMFNDSSISLDPTDVLVNGRYIIRRISTQNVGYFRWNLC